MSQYHLVNKITECSSGPKGFLSAIVLHLSTGCPKKATINQHDSLLIYWACPLAKYFGLGLLSLVP